MIRLLGTILSVICIGTVLTEAVGFGFLWMSGRIDATSLADIKTILGGGTPAPPVADDEEKKKMPASNDDVMDDRVARVWELHRRQKEIALIKNTVTDHAAKVTTQQQTFQQQKKAFMTELETISKNLNTASAEQARGILKKLGPADAIASLMTLTLEQNVVLLKGMDAKTIATLIETFQQSNDPKQIERGQKIFAAISNGEPVKKVVDAGNNQFQPAPKEAPKEP